MRIDVKQILAFCCCRKPSFAPEIDLFASHINTQFHICFLSARSKCFCHRCIYCKLRRVKFYVFPPFSLIAAVLSKIQNEGGEGICVLLDWSTQSWYAKAFQMMTKPPVRLKASPDLLILPSHPKEQHSIWTKINLLVCLRKSLERYDLSSSAQEILMASCLKILMAIRYFKTVSNLFK